MQFLQLLVALCVLILVHECGHFIFAKIFGIRVEKFYLFFDIGGRRLFSTKHNKFIAKYFPKLHNAQTDYGIGWLPLGGYCKISGMVDESMDVDALKQEPQPYEFRTHPAWQRLLVMFGGVLMNFILAFAVFTGMLASNGQSYISNEDNCIYTNELSRQMGFRTGDRILSYDDYQPEKFNMLTPELARRSPSVVTVLRGTDTVRLHIDHALIGEMLDSPDFFTLALPFVVDSIPPSSINYGSGLEKGDRICSMGGVGTPFVQDSKGVLKRYAGNTVEAEILRGRDSLKLNLQVDSSGLIGVFLEMPQIHTQNYSIAEAIPAGISYTFKQIGGYLQDLKLVATPSTGAYKQVGSFVAMGQVFPKLWDWNIFLNLLAMFSIMLGVMNLIPIPGLDGGHIVFTLYEMLTGRKPSDKFLMVTQMIGMALLMLLLFIAFGNDIGRLIR